MFPLKFVQCTAKLIDNLALSTIAYRMNNTCYLKQNKTKTLITFRAWILLVSSDIQDSRMLFQVASNL